MRENKVYSEIMDMRINIQEKRSIENSSSQVPIVTYGGIRGL